MTVEITMSGIEAAFAGATGIVCALSGLVAAIGSLASLIQSMANGRTGERNAGAIRELHECLEFPPQGRGGRDGCPAPDCWRGGCPNRFDAGGIAPASISALAAETTTAGGSSPPAA